MKKYVFIICLILCLTGCTTHVNLNTPEQTQEQTTSEYATPEDTTSEDATPDDATSEDTTQEKIPLTEKYIIDKKLLEYNNDKISWKLECPVLNGESDYYNEVNALLIKEIEKLAVPYTDMDLEGHFYYTGRYEIFEQSSDVISLSYVISTFYEHAANPFECCYGLTVDIETAELVALSAYVEDINTSLAEIEKGNYTVSYGEFSYEPSNEVKSRVEKTVSECELSKSYNNFYLDDGAVCFIVNGVIGSDYSVIRMNTK